MMPTTTFYHWNVAGSPVNILVELPVVDRFRAVATSSAAEIGGLLLGHFEGSYTIVTDFDAIDSEHRRGSAFTLSRRDEPRLRQQLEFHRKRGATVVGYFRSHQRPGMFLDEGDFQIISSYFNLPTQVALLIRPAENRTAVGGFFFWEDGELDRKQSYLQFPMSARELEDGDYPLLEPVYHDPATGNAVKSAAGNASDAAVTQTTYGSVHDMVEVLPKVQGIEGALPAQETPKESRASASGATRVRAEKPADPLAVAASSTGPSTKPASTIEASGTPRFSWPLIGMIAAVAAFGGYLIGTSGGHRDGFGARPGDMTLDSTPNPQEPGPSAANNPKPAETAPAPASSPPSNGAQPDAQSTTPATAKPASASDAVDRPSPMPKANQPASQPLKAVQPVTAPDPQPQNSVSDTTVPVTATPAPVTPATPSTTPGWQHFGNQPNGAAPLAAVPSPNPSIPSNARAESSVYLEALEDGEVKRALGKFPLFGHYKGGADFTPPQALRNTVPAVPSDLARQLTTSTPVDLKLKVDKTGKVTSVEILSRTADAQLVRLAGDAAYTWQFEPARMKDKAVSSDVIAHFRFRPAI